MIKELKKEIVKNIKQFMDKELYNHRKDKEGLISAQNCLLQDVERMLYDWADSRKSYLDMKLELKLSGKEWGV